MSTYTTLLVPERIQRLKEELLSTSTRFCFERARIVTHSYQETEGQHPALRRAKALRDVFAQMPIFIRPGELIVGQRAAVLAGRAVYPEFNLNGLTQETTPAEIWDYWHGNRNCRGNTAGITRPIGHRVKSAHPERLRLAEEEMAAAFCTGTASGFGHVIVDYEKAIRRGFRSIVAETRTHLAKAPEDDLEGRAFLQAVVIAAKGIITWAERYADLATEQAAKEPDPQRRAELERIARTCRRVPAEPARDFAEALQAFWFTHMAMHIEQYGWSISAGRFDQYMWPYYQQDIASEALTQKQAWELLLNLWVKYMENVGTRVKETTFQNLTLGGQDAEGRDQTNALSALCIDATVALRFNQPALSVRWHPNIDPAFWARAHEAIAEGLGMPALFSDPVILAALIAHGVAPEDAIGYGIVGCVEASIPGKEQGVTAGGHINVAKALELALNDGRSTITGRQIGLPTGDPRAFDSFEDLWKAYVTQVEYLAGLNVLATHIAGEEQKRSGYCPLMSSLLDDCLANRRDLVWGGTRYNLPGIAIYGPSNVYDGLMAIKKCICEEGRLTWAELHQALIDNFTGPEGVRHERVRQMLAHSAPRFGNGDPEVDALANRVNDVHADFCWKQVDSRNGRYTCGVWPVNGHVHAGHWVGATPDGRRSGAPLVDGVGACQGADRNGPTALLQSVARLDNVKNWPAGNTCNVKFSPGSVRSEHGVQWMADLTATFLRLGGQELQVNVVDTETLRAAQADPGTYTDLIVRVAGYSAYFTQLGRDVQEEIISRTEQRV
jgi:pyruvate formate-lyase/glycerol dehydratase family glycyl radical enzyme